MCTGYLLSQPGSRGEHQYLQTPRAPQKHGQHSQPLLYAYIPQKTRPQLIKMGQTTVVRAWPAKHTEQQLAYVWLVPFLPLLSLFPYCFFPDACKSHRFLPLSALLLLLFSCIASSFLSIKVPLLKFPKAS